MSALRIYPIISMDYESILMQDIVQSMERLQTLAWYKQREDEHVRHLRDELQNFRKAKERREKRNQANLEQRRRKRQRMRVKNPNRKEIAEGCECEYIPPEHRAVDMCNKCARLNNFDRSSAM